MQEFDPSDSESDRSDSVTDSAFLYKAQAAQKFAAGGQGGPEFDRMSQRLEKDLGLGNDMDSLMSVERGADFAQVRGPFSGQDYCGQIGKLHALKACVRCFQISVRALRPYIC